MFFHGGTVKSQIAQAVFCERINRPLLSYLFHNCRDDRFLDDAELNAATEALYEDTKEDLYSTGIDSIVRKVH